MVAGLYPLNQKIRSHEKHELKISDPKSTVRALTLLHDIGVTCETRNRVGISVAGTRTEATGRLAGYGQHYSYWRL